MEINLPTDPIKTDSSFQTDITTGPTSGRLVLKLNQPIPKHVFFYYMFHALELPPAFIGLPSTFAMMKRDHCVVTLFIISRYITIKTPLEECWNDGTQSEITQRSKLEDGERLVWQSEQMNGHLKIIFIDRDRKQAPPIIKATRELYNHGGHHAVNSMTPQSTHPSHHHQIDMVKILHMVNLSLQMRH